jgi:hypothetical protein
MVQELEILLCGGMVSLHALLRNLAPCAMKSASSHFHTYACLERQKFAQMSALQYQQYHILLLQQSTPEQQPTSTEFQLTDRLYRSYFKDYLQREEMDIRFHEHLFDQGRKDLTAKSLNVGAFGGKIGRIYDTQTEYKKVYCMISFGRVPEDDRYISTSRGGSRGYPSLCRCVKFASHNSTLRLGQRTHYSLMRGKGSGRARFGKICGGIRNSA